MSGIDWKDFARVTENLPISSLGHRALGVISIGARARVLDLGAGGLRDTRAFLNAGCAVDAVDNYPGFAVSGGKLPSHRLLRIEHDLRVGFPKKIASDRYDIVLANFSLPYLPQSALLDILEHSACAIRPGGVIAFNLFGVHHFNPDENHVVMANAQVHEIANWLMTFGFEGAPGQALCSEYRYDHYDWKGRLVHWHYYELLFRKKS